MQKQLPSPDDLRKLLSYDPETGRLFWLSRDNHQFNSKFCGRPAGSLGARGYIKLSINGICITAHRAVWALEFGKWPDGQIDHVNGVKHDNRISNLRDVTSEQNNRNRRLHRNSKTGIMGVIRFDIRWRANIWHNGGNHYLGTFNCIGKAIACRKKAERDHGFHSNHGKPKTQC